MHQQLTERPVDLDPRETAEWLEALDQIVEGTGPDRASFLPRQADGTRACERSLAAGPHLHGLRQYDSGRKRKFPTPATARSNAASRASCAGTRWPWCPTRTSTTTASAATSPPIRRSPRCSKWASIISSTPAIGDQPGDLIYFQGHASPGVYARAFLEGRLSEDHLKISATNCARRRGFPPIRIRG